MIQLVPRICFQFSRLPIKFVPTVCGTNGVRSTHSTIGLSSNNLSQFFDEPKNWEATEVKSGRSWQINELRIKSSVDLHKLWYVLLKERNMLLTMEHNCAKACQLFPSPERLDKVNESMERIEQTIQERNSAYWKLEIGEDVPVDTKNKKPELSPDDPLAAVRHATELVTQVKSKAVLKFEYLLKEKEKKELKKQKRRNEQYVMGLLKRFPNLDMEALKVKYPDVRVEKLLFRKKTLGHHEHNTA